MEPETFIARCPRCNAKNRIPRAKLGKHAVCGKCGTPLSTADLFPERPIDVTDRDFDREVLRFSGPAVVEFWSPRCGYCTSFAPIFERAARDFLGRIKFAKVNTDTNPMTSSRYAIRGTPSLLFFKNSRLVDTLPGAVSAEQFNARLARFLNG